MATGVAPQLSGQDLMGRIAGEGLREPLESDYLMVGLNPLQLLKRRAFVRYFRSANVYTWKRAVMVCMPGRGGQVMDGVDGLLLGTGGRGADVGRQIRLDVLLYDELVDNFKEEGFLSVALHIMQRLLGDVEKHPDNLVKAVNYADHLERKYQKCQEQL